MPQKVPPQNNVYDYILFRGTDIRDIVVLNNAPTYPNDPAIMQLTLQPKPYQSQAFGQGMMGPPPVGPHLGQFPPAGYGGIMLGGMAAPGLGGVAGAAVARDQARGFPKPSELTMPGEIPPPDLSPAAAVEPPTPDGHGKSQF